jgi:L-aspartate oxidase
MAALASAVAKTDSITVVEGIHAIELATCDGRIAGVFARSAAGGGEQRVLFRGKAVILASGGIGALYSRTTNPPDARGEGLGMAARAGALTADPEFVQFHPTAMDVGRDPAPLVTEALRGEGATLIDESGRRFMQDVHPAGELAPRDVVARAIFRESARGHRVFLDGRTAPGDRFALEFPTVYDACRNAGLDPARDPIPIAPAAHYHMGGVATDRHGRSSLRGLWCVGECACTGLHGANRLASNSLLEAMVFGARVADGVRAETDETPVAVDPPSRVFGPSKPLPEDFRAAMMQWVGLERDATGLKEALSLVTASESANADDPRAMNALAAAKLVAAGALIRRESIGAHFRRDFPVVSGPRQRTFLTLAQAEHIAAAADVPELDSRMVQR